jgi:hypothetical protein
MKKTAAALVLSFGMATGAYAFGPPPPLPPPPPPPPPSWWGPPPPVHRAPEIDPAGAIAGLTFLAGGLAVLRGRRRTTK